MLAALPAQVEHGVHALDGLGHGGRVGEVGDDLLLPRAGLDRLEIGEPQDATLAGEPGAEQRADFPRGTGHENAHVFMVYTILTQIHILEY
ncbi:hypothetical protein GCM10009734_06210 [Nonomuraea bangladeshensis]